MKSYTISIRLNCIFNSLSINLLYENKKPMPNRLIIVVVLVLVSKFCFSQTSAPKYSNEFLSLGVGARALGMSNVQTALARDVTASYWNPAALANLENKYQGGLMHASYFAGIANYDYGSFAVKLDSTSALGFSLIRFAIDDIPDTRFLYDANGSINYDNIRFFSAADYAFLASFGRKMPSLSGLNMGMNVKVVHRRAGQFASAWGFGMDAAAQLEINTWKFGLMLKDITGTFNAWSHNTDMVKDVYTTTGNEIPKNSLEVTLPKAIMGIGKNFMLTKNLDLLTAVDVDITFDGKRNVPVKTNLFSLDPHLGIELGYADAAFIRFGVKNFQEYSDLDQKKSWDYQPDFGLGIKIKNANIDYAFTDIGNVSESLYSHVFSLIIGFEEKR
jgi:hypothetical protein